MRNFLFAILYIISFRIYGQELPKQKPSIGRDSAITVQLFDVFYNSLSTPDTLKVKLFADSLNNFSKHSLWVQTTAYNNLLLGMRYLKKGYIRIAYKALDDALKVFRVNKNDFGIGMTLSHISVIITQEIYNNPVLDSATYQQYFKYLEEALEISKKNKNPMIVSNQEISLGLFHFTVKHYHEAYKHYKNSTIPYDEKDGVTFHFHYGGIWAQGLCSLYINKTEDGFKKINYVKKICKIPRKDNRNNYILAIMGIFLGQYYYEKGNYELALKELNDGYKAYLTFKSSFFLNQYNKVYYITYKALGNYKEALEYYEAVQKYNQLEERKNFQQNYLEFQLKYDDEKQKTIIQKLENEKLQTEANRNNWIRNLLILSLLIGLIFLLYTLWANRKLRQKNAEIEEALLKGQTLERKRVAQELHDNLSAKISGIRWRLESIQPDFNIEKQKQIYESSVNALSEVYTDVRLISHNLLPAELELKGMRFALENLVKELNSLERTQFELEVDDSIKRFGNKAEYELFSVILELSNNILKHSGAKDAKIAMHQAGNRIVLIVEDNGKGLGENAHKGGMGMKNMKARIENLGGSFSIESNEGVKAQIEIPI
ncbi:MAG: sensor histidine kinase [Spirosomataceae bacterium]